MLEPPEEFTDLVRDALLNVYDMTALQRQPLLAAVGGPEESIIGRARLLRRALLDAIHALHPGPGVATTSRAWRTFRLLELRYLEGCEAATAAEQVALSRSQYHREHHRGLQTVAALLWERWQLTGRWLPPAGQWPAAPIQAPARLEAERLLRPLGEAERFDLAELADGIRRVLGPLCAARGVELALTLPDDPPAVVGERVVLRQALLALLAPTIAHTAEGPVRVTFATRDGEVEIVIEARLAEPLPPGALGIDESRPFVEALRGSLSHQPATGWPARWAVWLTLPAAAGPTLLVVDNNADFVRLITFYLNGHDWLVVGRADVDAALAYAQERPPRAILLDVVLPGRDGWELLLALKDSPATRAIPVLICSVLDEPAIAMGLGAAAYLHKPVEQRALVAALKPFRSPAGDHPAGAPPGRAAR